MAKLSVPVKNLDPKLRDLVHKVVALFGQVVKRNADHGLYDKIEHMRRRMTRLRVMTDKRKVNELRRALGLLEDLTFNEQVLFAHSFGLMLEIMNACETAFRTYKLMSRPTFFTLSQKNKIVYVLTAHPTEARAPSNMKVFRELEKILVKVLCSDLKPHASQVMHLLEMIWKVPITRQRKPRVEDEAEYIYSLALNDEMIRSLLDANREVCPVYLRSWVGGDKDGHPGVNEKTMLASLKISRLRLLKFITKSIKTIKEDLKVLGSASLVKDFSDIDILLSKMKKIKIGDAGHAKNLRGSFETLSQSYEKSFGCVHPAISDLKTLGNIFPAFVMPLELRESSDVLMTALQNDHLAINKMVSMLKRISVGGNPLWYVRGFIVSMASQFEHIGAAKRILSKYLGGVKIPIIPLFEQEQALRASVDIVKMMLQDPVLKKSRQRYWQNQFEIMLGYSDSAKEIGVFQSRVLIGETISILDRLCKRHGAVPVFFHGSGGSIDRGGGSIREQTAWWPKSSLQLFKATIQGEMVERSFSSPDIFRSQIERIALEAHENKRSRPQNNHAIDDLASRASAEYKRTIGNQSFLEIIERATPYKYLNLLKMGSRPSKRASTISLSSLRAIPWILCWTQTRTLFPTWWGLGSAWLEASNQDKNKIKKAFNEDPLFRSYIKALGFTLSKVELAIWQLYLEASGLDQQIVKKTIGDFQREFLLTTKFVRAMSGKSSLLWFRPWLEDSIHLRAPMIHPLNLLQIITMKKGDPFMIRETVAGIANGMFTTG